MKRRIVSTAMVAIVVVAFGTGLVDAGTPTLPPPGGHLFALEPMNQFPPQGMTNSIPVIGRLELDLDDPACGGGLTEPLALDVAGNLIVTFPNPEVVGTPSTIEIQIVSLELRSVAPITVAGLGGHDVLIHEVPPSGGQLSNPSNAQFPVDSFFDVFVQIEFPGSGCPTLETPGPFQLQGTMVGWPPADALLGQGPPVPLADESMNPAGDLMKSILIPTTPSAALLKGEAIQHEAEQQAFEQSIEEAIQALGQGLAPLPGEHDDTQQKIDEVRQFLQTMKDVVDAVSEQTEGSDDCKGGSDCGPLLEKKVNKLTKKVNNLRKLIKNLD